MTAKVAGLLAIVIAAAMMWAIPTASSGKSVDLRKTGDAVRQVTDGLAAAVDESLAKTAEELRQARERARAAAAKAKQRKATPRAPTATPTTQPPLHGTNPHAQGGVGVVDTNPSSERPLGYDASGAASGEEVIIGRARGEKNGPAYHGHITIAALLGQEVAGVDSVPGETKNGPLQPLQTGVLDPLCTTSQVCLSVLTANSTTTATGSTNDFAVARASALGLGVGAAESNAAIGEDANCQTAVGSAKTVNVTSRSTAVASAANSSSSSKSCSNAAPVVSNTSSVVGLAGVGVPIPATGCDNGTPDTVFAVPAVLTIVCNADDIAGAAAVREALDVFVLPVPGVALLPIVGTSLAKETTAASESLTVAPAAPPPPPEASKKQCEDGMDNDDDGKIDADDPGCHEGGTLSGRYNPKDDDESDDKTAGSGDPECSDDRDNDGDGKSDADDPGCHEGNDINNPYNPDDDSEANRDDDAPTGGQKEAADTLPFTGTDVVGLSLAGLLMLAGGLLLRRREDTHPAL